MPIFMAAFLGGVYNFLATAAGRILIALGISYVTYQGLDTGLDWIKLQALSNISAIGGTTFQIITILNVGEAISIVFSAYAARLVLAGITASGLSRQVFKK